MKYRLPTWVYDYAHRIAKIPFAKSLLKPIYYPIKDLFAKRRNRNFKLYALEALSRFDQCMTENGFNYSLIFGSLLGAIREKGFISHDCDIDTALFVEERSPKLYEVLKDAGFNLIYRFSIKDGSIGCEETFVYKNTGITIDIFYICKAIDEFPYVCCWNYGAGCASYRETMKRYGGVVPRRIELPYSRNILRVPFENIYVNIPENAHQISEFSYGPDYMTPKQNYMIPTAHRYVWFEEKAIFEEFL